MALTFDMPEDIGGGGNFLREPGRYHFAVIETDENPSKKSGEPIDGFKIAAEVQQGDEQGKHFDFVFHNPKPTSRDGGAFSKRKIGACMIALGFATPENMGKGMTIELSDAVDRQFFAEVGFEKNEDGGDKVDDQGRKFLQLVWSNIYHVDDPAAKDFSRNEAALKLLPKSHRVTDPTFFDRIRGKKTGGNGSVNGSQAKKPKAPTPAPAAKVAPATATAAAVSSDLADL